MRRFIFCASWHIMLGVKIEDGDMGEACGMHEREEEFVQCSGWKA
jgi:hypothetical protein